MSPLIEENEYIEVENNEQKTRLYVVCGMPEETPVLTQTRKEISDIAWVQVQDLPTNKNPDVSLVGSSGKPSKLFMVIPYVGTCVRACADAGEALVRCLHLHWQQWQ